MARLEIPAKIRCDALNFRHAEANAQFFERSNKSRV
jgi:hypothetical protein